MTHPTSRRIILAVLALVGLPCLIPDRASAGIIIYNKGQDDGVSPGDPLSARVEYNAGLSAFKSDVGVFSTITFEGLKPGPYNDPTAPERPADTTIDVGQGVHAVLHSVEPAPPVPDANGPYVFGVTGDHPSSALGYNVTNDGTKPVGSQFLRFVPFLKDAPADLTFNFSSGVTAFGMAVTGLGALAHGDLRLLFTTGGVAADLMITGTDHGGIQFFGVSNLPTPISSFTLEMRGVTAAQRDIISIDDVRFAAVPEPASAVLFAVGVTATLGGAFLRSRAAPGRP